MGDKKDKLDSHHQARVTDVIGWRAYIKHGVLALLVIILLLAWLWSPKVDFIRPVNVTPSSQSVGTLTSQPSRPCAYLIREFRVVRECSKRNGSSHLIKFTDLSPESSYLAIVKTGLRLHFRSGLTTPTISQEQPPLPEPAYGTLVDTDSNPVPGAVVYISSSQRPDVGLATVTDDNGNYALDLSVLPDEVSQLELEIIVDRTNRAQEAVLREFVTPIQTITVNRL